MCLHLFLPSLACRHTARDDLARTVWVPSFSTREQREELIQDEVILNSSVSHQPRDDWGHRLSIGDGRRNIGKTVALSQLHKLLADLLYGAHQVEHAFE